jgi:hypothetical protein
MKKTMILKAYSKQIHLWSNGNYHAGKTTVKPRTNGKKITSRRVVQRWYVSLVSKTLMFACLTESEFSEEVPASVLSLKYIIENFTPKNHFISNWTELLQSWKWRQMAHRKNLDGVKTQETTRHFLGQASVISIDLSHSRTDSILRNIER